MALTGALTALGLQIGTSLARSVGANLTNRPKAGEKLKRVEALITTGTTAMDAFCKIFGPEFYEALNSALGSGQSPWTYEAGRADYIRVDAMGGMSRSVHQALRDELNINLDRIARTHGKSGADVHNYFSGVFREWMTRYRDLVGHESDSEQTFEVIECLLDGRRRTFADVFRLLQQTGLGTLGALLLIQAVLVATSTGVGVLAAISTWLFGIPGAQVGALAVGGTLLFALSRVKLVSTNAMSVSVATAYKLLERTAKSGTERSTLSH